MTLLLRSFLLRGRFFIPLALAAGLLAGVLCGLRPAEYSVSATAAVLAADGNQSPSRDTVEMFLGLIPDPAIQEVLAREAGLDAFSGRATVTRLGKTNIFSIQVTARDVELAYREANALLEQYDAATRDTLEPLTLALLEKPVKPDRPQRGVTPLSAACQAALGVLAVLAAANSYFTLKRRSAAGAPRTGRVDLGTVLRRTGTRVKRFWWVLALTAALGCAVSLLSMADRYSARAVFSVSAAPGGDEALVIRQAGEVAPGLLESPLLEDRAQESLGRDLSGLSVSARAVNGSNIIALSVTGKDPNEAWQALSALMDQFPPLAGLSLGEVALRVLLESGIPAAPDPAPGPVLRGLLGALCGAGILLALMLLYGLGEPPEEDEGGTEP